MANKLKGYAKIGFNAIRSGIGVRAQPGDEAMKEWRAGEVWAPDAFFNVGFASFGGKFRVYGKRFTGWVVLRYQGAGWVVIFGKAKGKEWAMADSYEKVPGEQLCLLIDAYVNDPESVIMQE